jgi:integrase
MAREIERLSAGKVQRASEPGMYPDGAGLFLRIGPSGAKSWIFRYADGKTASGQQRNRDMGLGPVHTFGLAEARERAKQQRQLRDNGGDPITARNAAREAARALKATMDFAEAAEAYMTAMEPSWSRDWAAQWRSSLKEYAYPIIGILPIASIDRPAVLRVITPIWNDKTETASRVRARIEAVIGWAIQHGHRPEGANPAAWKKALEHALPKKTKIAKVEHHPALPYADLPAFMAALRVRSGMPARALRFTILTAARTGETIGALWSEIDLEAGTWIIPAGRMKGGRQHVVPLSDAALAILAALPRKGEKVFPGVSGNAMPYILRTTPGGQSVTVHGFRSSFRDWAAENGISRDLAEASLAHNDKGATEAAYNRTSLIEQRRPVMASWAQFCAGEADGAKVVQLRAS